jgi:osmoprotectant transport system ATP-binding protein
VIRLDAVSKRYGNGAVAVNELTLDVDAGDIAVLVGPSGCGKTTILRMVNRLIEPTSGRIYLDDEDVTTVDPVGLRRRIGYVIQQVGLFPHQTIATNVATVPRLLGWNRARVEARVDELLAMVGLEPRDFRDRYPAQLSGGQRQRVGVARALAADPPVLLMDEPFGAIDPITRTRLQDEFLRLQSELRKTVVFVTHDIDEAVKMGTRIALLNVGGHLEQYDSPARILGSPATDFVADFVGRDRALKRLQVTTIADVDVEPAPVVAPTTSAPDVAAALDRAGAEVALVVDPARPDDLAVTGRFVDGTAGTHAEPIATIAANASLEAALALVLLGESGQVAVLVDGRPGGVLTMSGIHRSLRRSVDDGAFPASSDDASGTEVDVTDPRVQEGVATRQD